MVSSCAHKALPCAFNWITMDVEWCVLAIPNLTKSGLTYRTLGITPCINDVFCPVVLIIYEYM